MKIGYCYVVGDIVHRGHILHLKNCKVLCDTLICGVLTDKATMEKKPRPILSLPERLEIIGSIKYVDIVICQDEYSPLQNCKALRPDILFESASHDIQPANNFMKSIGGRVLVMPYYPVQSSTKIKEGVKHVKKNNDCSHDSTNI